MDKKIKVELLEEIKNLDIVCNHKTVTVVYKGRMIGIAEIDIDYENEVSITKIIHTLDENIFNGSFGFSVCGKIIQNEGDSNLEFLVLGIELIKKIGG